MMCKLKAVHVKGVNGKILALACEAYGVAETFLRSFSEAEKKSSFPNSKEMSSYYEKNGTLEQKMHFPHSTSRHQYI